MGYRIKLSRLPKSCVNKYNKLSFKTLEEITNVEEDDSFRALPEQKELLTLQVDLNDKFFSDFVTPFFKNFELREYNGNCFALLSKKGLFEVIELYNKSIVSLLDEQIKHIEEGNQDITLFNIKKKKEKWEFEIAGRKFRPYRIEDNQNKDYLDGSIVSDGSVEYQIFNVVFIYNTFDWENYELIISGW